ncbi:MAG TPA: SLBB domain-containing protein [Pirellulales bacterium]
MPKPQFLSATVAAALLACIAGCGVFGTAITADSTVSSFTKGLVMLPAYKYLKEDTKDVVTGVPISGSAPCNLQKTAASPYTIRPADGLTLEPLTRRRSVKFMGEQTVRLDGSIDLGKYGRLFVAGQTLEQVEVDASAAVEALELHPVRISVRLSKPAGDVYYVLGEVNAPGAYPLTGHETIVDAIAAAKGLTAHASLCRMLLTRLNPAQSGQTEIPICYRQILQSGDTSANLRLMPGDRIVVPELSILELVLPAYRRCARCRGLQSPSPAPAVLDQGAAQPIDTLPEPALEEALSQPVR